VLILYVQLRSKLSQTSVYQDTTARQTEDLSGNIFSTQKSKCLNFVFCSVDMNESKDATGTAQLAIFIHGVNKNFKIIDELAALYPLRTVQRLLICTELCKIP
jgi:hypothetical protein